MARDVDSLTLSIQHSLPTAASPTLPGGFGEAIEASGCMPNDELSHTATGQPRL